MEKLIRGTDVRDSESFSGKCFCELSMVVKKGHYECGDSAFIYYDSKKLIAAVFDGVSGEPGAAMASSDAAAAILEHLKGRDMADEETLKEAFTKAHLAIRLGFTTVSLVFLEKGGAFAIASIGDSPIFGMDAKGKASLELTLARVVGDGDSILKFFQFRNIVTSVLGSTGEINICTASGKLKKGQALILATDGLSDNLFVETKEGYVTDSSGTSDLQALIKTKKRPKDIVNALSHEIARRVSLGRQESDGRILVPKEDDIAIIALRLADKG